MKRNASRGINEVGVLHDIEHRSPLQGFIHLSRPTDRVECPKLVGYGCWVNAAVRRVPCLQRSCSRCGRATFGLEDSRGRSWIFRKLGGRPPWAREQLTAAVRANSGEALVGAITTERALEGANPSSGRIGRQISLAALASGSHLKHDENLRKLGRPSLNEAG